MTSSSCSAPARLPLAKSHQIRGECPGMFRVRRVFKSAGFGVGSPIGTRERCMNKFAIRLLTLAMFSMALIAAPCSAAYAAPTAIRRRRSSDKGKKKERQSPASRTPRSRAVIARPTPRSMTATTMPRRSTQLKALGQDDRADGRQPDRLLLSQARRLQGFADLVRARAEGRPEPRQDLAVLRAVAGRTGQPRSGAISSEPDRRFGRHRQRGISLARRRAGKAARHRPRLLS